MKHVLNLNEGITPFLLGEHIDKYKDRYEHEYEPAHIYDPASDWDGYCFFEDDLIAYAHTVTGLIESLRCVNHCYLNGENLIGMKIVDFFEKDLVKETYSMEQIYLSDDQLDDVYDFDESGLQIWVDPAGIIETIFIHKYESEVE